MSYNQMMKVTGLTKMTCIKIVQNLEDLGLLTVHRSETTKYNIKLNKPITETNRYVVNLLGIIPENDNKEKDINEEELFNVCNKNCINCFNACLCNMFSNKELKIILSKRNYSEVIKYREYCTNVK